MKLGGAHAGEQFRHATVPGCLTYRLGRRRQQARQRFETIKQCRRPDPAQSPVDGLEERRQDGSAPKVLSRVWCHAAAAASSPSMG